jgi:transcriptional regulator with XRE-family HTH domain
MEQQTIGELLRYLRAQSGRSQAEQADVLSDLAGRPITRNEISRWESERRLLTKFWQQYVAASFDVDVTHLRRAVAATRAGRRQDDEKAGGVLQRREFIGAMAALALPLNQATAIPAGRRVGNADVDQLYRHTARLRRVDNFMGGGDTYQMYASEVDTTTRLLQDAQYTSEIGRRLHSLLAEQMQQAGWAAFDAGDQAQARRCYVASGRAAEEAGSAELVGNALAYAAYQQTATAQSGTATAEASYEVARQVATPKVSALLLERKAWAHAVAGEARQADSALNQAREALHVADARPEPDWVFWIDESEIDIMAGRCWTELRRPLRAVPVLESVLSRFDETHARDKALYLTWLATSYLQAREVEQAAATLSQALDLSAGVASVRPMTRITGVARRLARHRDVPEVAAVLERIEA